jgi:hypothetical protein
VELHGGSITAQSGGVQQGSTFIVRIPISSRLAAAGVPPASISEQRVSESA